ncbi:serine carboxypeptidase-like 45 isoform X2 [Rhodamnia argentea]|uniref:Carboxypeptidase n=1 Tax=Rhodamnia argentea TaxID=178133 RepID=A0A8B8N8I2_9MYRT|nr:serine carboxypeptidase-like 45 isoform X2 [Rhodamnia argentea]
MHLQLVPWLTAATLCVTLTGICSSSTLSTVSDADRIVSLPGQPKVCFSQYAGYITVHKKQQRDLFYYFAEAEADPRSKPLVLWLNGGPGCSSVGIGAFSEHGPFKPSGDVLRKNDYSWNKEANMLYLESPAGVGFSYSVNNSYYISVDDKMTAKDNLAFLRNWFKKFPEYKNRDLFITGESYAGHYVPQLAKLIVQSKLFNLKGIAIGNPLLEYNTDFNSRAEFLWSHGLISDATYKSFNTICNFSQIIRQRWSDALTPGCSHVLSEALREISNFVDGYDVTLDVCLSTVSSQSAVLNKPQETEKIDVCVPEETVKYLNRKEVQEALHARLVGISRWTTCSSVLKYEMQNLETPTVPILGELVKSGIHVLVYSGDQDAAIPFIGTRTIVNKLAKQLGLNTTVPYSVWFEERQVAGWTQVYGDKLSYATIRGASHEAPFSQPERSLVLFSSFLGGGPLPEGLLSESAVRNNHINITWS